MNFLTAPVLVWEAEVIEIFIPRSDSNLMANFEQDIVHLLFLRGLCVCIYIYIYIKIYMNHMCKVSLMSFLTFLFSSWPGLGRINWRTPARIMAMVDAETTQQGSTGGKSKQLSFNWKILIHASLLSSQFQLLPSPLPPASLIIGSKFLWTLKSHRTCSHKGMDVQCPFLLGH